MGGVDLDQERSWGPRHPVVQRMCGPAGPPDYERLLNRKTLTGLEVIALLAGIDERYRPLVNYVFCARLLKDTPLRPQGDERSYAARTHEFRAQVEKLGKWMSRSFARLLKKQSIHSEGDDQASPSTSDELRARVEEVVKRMSRDPALQASIVSVDDGMECFPREAVLRFAIDGRMGAKMLEVARRLDLRPGDSCDLEEFARDTRWNPELVQAAQDIPDETLGPDLTRTQRGHLKRKEERQENLARMSALGTAKISNNSAERQEMALDYAKEILDGCPPEGLGIGKLASDVRKMMPRRKGKRRSQESARVIEDWLREARKRRDHRVRWIKKMSAP